MTESKKSSGLTRRTLVKGAAWSVPVVAAAFAVPLAAASVGNATVTWASGTDSLLMFNVLDGGGTVQANSAVTVPTAVILQNGDDPIDGVIDGTITIEWASGVPSRTAFEGIPGNVVIRGFGVRSIPGTILVGQRSSTPHELFQVPSGTGLASVSVDQTAQSFQLVNPVLDNAQEVLGSVSFALTNRTAYDLIVDMVFNVTVTLSSNGKTIGQPAVAQISVPFNAGIL